MDGHIAADYRPPLLIYEEARGAISPSRFHDVDDEPNFGTTVIFPFSPPRLSYAARARPPIENRMSSSVDTPSNGQAKSSKFRLYF